MPALVVKPLDASTWDAYARLALRHNGVWGGCWCTWFHTTQAEKTHTAEGNRALKERLVCEGRAHAAVVFDGEAAVAWCQYGPPVELPNIHHRKEYEATQTTPPDYRLTCIFVDKAYRRQGVAAVALRGALHLIAQAGGGTVEGYPHDTQGKKVSASFLYNGTRRVYEQAGFTYLRPKGKGNCVMSRVVPAG
ncbi:GNAT family N-acetyltransferase [Deinococcus koreensis]|uniref:GNAT family N-acetyltransferase n=1 Tax=Deinococcus koreensis TaxID=2054903 RepID=A0A2K3V2A6_9DEIO|nr:GNAT family N-acetyltransferase [Deinococcus koreensis]